MENKRDRFNCFRILLLIFLLTPSLLYAEVVADPEDDTDPALEAEIAPEPIVVKDPFEKVNRVVFRFNDAVDQIVLKPIATFYNAVMPHPLNRGVHNFFMNINNVTTAANDILQLHFQQAANDLWRLGINSTIGIGGLFDVAGRMGLPPYSNDFGITMAHYGYTNSTFIVIPFFGPNTIRDGLSIPVDYYAFSIYPYIEPPSSGWQLYGLGVIDLRAQLLQYQSVLDEAAIDKYSFQRNAYLQRRAYKIKQNEQLGQREITSTKPENNVSLPGVNIGR